jgi:hypothetical protein
MKNNPRIMTPGALRSFRRLQHKCDLAELSYYFKISKAQACRIRAGENWGKKC